MSRCRRSVPGQTDEYSGVARFYDFLIEPFMHGLRKAVAARIGELGRRSVLDVACGTGRQLSMLGGAMLSRTGIDASAAMLSEARKKTPAGIGYVQGDAANMPFDDGTFDCIGVTFALHEMPADDREAAVLEMLRVLSPGGRLLIIDYDRPGGAPARTALAAASLVERAAGARHFDCFRDFVQRGGVPGLVSGLGLPIVKQGPLLFKAAGLFEAAPD